MRLLFRVVIAIFVIIAGLLILKAVAEHFNLSGVKYFLNQLFMFADKILASIFRKNRKPATYNGKSISVSVKETLDIGFDYFS